VWRDVVKITNLLLPLLEGEVGWGWFGGEPMDSHPQSLASRGREAMDGRINAPPKPRMPHCRGGGQMGVSLP